MNDKIVQLKNKNGENIYPISISDKPVIAGIIIPYAGNGTPFGFLPCDGSAVSRTKYKALFDVIGTLWGAGDGSTTFNVPNLNGRTLIGTNNDHILATVGGEETHVLTTNEMPSHRHTRINYVGNDGWTLADTSGLGGTQTDTNTKRITAGSTISSTAASHFATNESGGGIAHNNMQPYATVNYIISTGIHSVTNGVAGPVIEDPHGMWCTVYGAPQITLGNSNSATTGLLSFQSITGSTDHQFQLSSDGGIICPYTGTVSLSSIVDLNTGFNQYDLIHLRFVKNKTTHMLHDVTYHMPYANYGSIVHPGGFQSVNPGDTIHVRLYNQTAARGTTTNSSSCSRISIAYI